jgi:hypothetical protein
MSSRCQASSIGNPEDIDVWEAHLLTRGRNAERVAAVDPLIRPTIAIRSPLSTSCSQSRPGQRKWRGRSRCPSMTPARPPML